MKKILLLFSHKLTEKQIKKLEEMGIEYKIELPEELQKKWSNINPLEENQATLNEIIEFISSNIEKDDFVLVQGEFGMVFAIVDFALRTGIIPIYSATKRICYEKNRDDGTTEIRHIYMHENFKKYKRN